jgi:hypothetical protein
MTRVDRLGLVAVGLLALAMWLSRLEGPIDLRWDGGVYYTLGTALASGQGYRLLNEPGEIAANQYPPLFPALIAASQILLGSDDPFEVGAWLRLLACLQFVAYGLVVYAMLRRCVSRWLALPGTAVCLLNLHAYFMSDLCSPEIAHALCGVGFFLTRDRSSPVVPAAFAISAYSFRTAGMALFAAWAAEAVFERRFRTAALRLAIAIVPVVAWQAYVASVESSAEYREPAYAYQRADYAFYNVSYARNVFSLVDGFRPELGRADATTILARFVDNLREVPSSFGESMSTVETVWNLEWEAVRRRTGWDWLPTWGPRVTVLVLGWIVAAALGVQVACGRWFGPFFVGASVMIACLTPWPGQFARYNVPLAPFFLLAVCEMWALATRHVRTAAVASGAALFAVILVQQTATAYAAFSRWHVPVTLADRAGVPRSFRLFFYHDAYRVLDEMLDRLRTEAAPDDVIAVSMPHWAYLRTGRKAVMPPFETDPHRAQALLDSVPVRYLIVDVGLAADCWRYTSPVVSTFPERWQLVHSSPVRTESGEPDPRDFRVYRRTEAQLPIR